MFSFYRGDVLIGHSRLESCDASMAVATGEFIPNKSFAAFKKEMVPARNGAGDVIPDWRLLGDLTVRDEAGAVMAWQDAWISELGQANAFAYEAECAGLDTYAEYFPEHV